MIKANEKKNYNKLKTYALDEKSLCLLDLFFLFFELYLK